MVVGKAVPVTCILAWEDTKTARAARVGPSLNNSTHVLA